jgi:hypothetical protein
LKVFVEGRTILLAGTLGSLKVFTDAEGMTTFLAGTLGSLKVFADAEGMTTFLAGPPLVRTNGGLLLIFKDGIELAKFAWDVLFPPLKLRFVELDVLGGTI